MLVNSLDFELRIHSKIISIVSFLKKKSHCIPYIAICGIQLEAERRGPSFPKFCRIFEALSGRSQRSTLPSSKVGSPSPNGEPNLQPLFLQYIAYKLIIYMRYIIRGTF